MPVTSLFHISDIHIRAGTSEASREDDYRATFDNLFGLLKTFPQIREGAGVIVVTGDIFHHKNVVGPAGLDLAIYLLRGLSALATTVVIRGNHDYRQELSDEKDMIRALMAYDIEDLHYFDKTDTYEVENIGFGVLAIQDTLLEGATAGSKDVLPTMPSVEGFSEDVTHRVALYHGEVTKASLQTGYVHVNRHTLPLTQFEGYDLVLLGDIHQQQVKVAEAVGFSGEAVSDVEATRLTTYTTRTGSWGYPSSLLQQNYGESLLGHGMLHWDLAASQVTEYHVHNPAGFVPLSVDAEETIRIQVRKGAEWMDETVLDEPWFPKRVRISVSVVGAGVRLSDSLLDRIRSSVEAHGIQVDRIHPSYATASSVAASASSGPSEASEKGGDNKDNKPISFYNSPEAWIQYIEEKNENKPLFEANPFWKDWVKTPSLALVPLDAVPPPLKPLFTTQNEKIFKSVAAFQKELDAFEQESRQTCVLSLQYLEWSWLFNFGPENWYNFADAQNSIVVLNAKNGCGKSNFFETICLALFGEGFPSRDSAHSAAVLNNRWTGVAGVAGGEQGPARTLLLFSLQGTPYSLERVFERRKDRRLLDFKTVILRRADTGALEHQGINAVREWVKANIGSVDMFLTSCMLTQDGDSNFFEKGADKQKEILDRVFSLHVVDELKTLLDVTYRAHGSCLTAVQAYLGGQGVEGAGGTLEELALLEKDLDSVRSRRVALDAEAIVVAGQWADHSPKTFTSRSLELYREEWEGLPEGVPSGDPSGDPSERARLQLRLEQLGPERPEPPLCSQPNGSKQEAGLLLKQLRAEEAGLQGCTGSASATRTLDECRTLLREAALWEKRRRGVVPTGGSVSKADAEARLEALMATTPQNPKVLSKLSPKAVAVLEETAKRCESDAAQVQRLGEALADYDATAARWLDVKRPLNPEEPFNPDCGACVSRKGGREGEKRLVQKRLTDLIDQFGERDDLVASHEEAVEAAAASSQALQDLEAWRQTQAWTAWKQAVQVAQADVASVVAAAAASVVAAEEERHWTRVKAEAASDLAFLVRLEVCKAEADVAAWTAWETRAQWDERALVEARLVVVEAQLAVAEAVLRKRTLGRIVAAYPAYLRDKELLVERAVIEADEGRLLARRTSVQRALEVAGLQETLKKIEIRREMAGCLVSTLNGYTKWLSTDKLAPRLRQEVSGLLESICEDRPLTLEGVWEDKGSGHLSWFLLDGTDRVVFQKASGFQRFIVGMAMRIAMSRLGLCRAEYKQLFLDEGFTACDAENLEKVPAFLRSLLGHLDTILLASHLEDLKASGDAQVRIERLSSGVARIASGTRIASAAVVKARGRPKKSTAVVA